MTFLIFKRPAAERDIEECFVHIAEENLNAGLAFLAAVGDSLDRLAEFPLLGEPMQFHIEQLKDVRVWHVKHFERFLVFYKVFEDRIELIRVLHSARDIEGLFG